MKGLLHWLTDFTGWSRAAAGVAANVFVFWALGTPVNGVTCAVAAAIWGTFFLAAIIQHVWRENAHPSDSQAMGQVQAEDVRL